MILINSNHKVDWDKVTYEDCDLLGMIPGASSEALSEMSERYTKELKEGKLSKEEYEERINSINHLSKVRFFTEELYSYIPFGMKLISYEGEEVIFDGENVYPEGNKYGFLDYGFYPND